MKLTKQFCLALVISLLPALIVNSQMVEIPVIENPEHISFEKVDIYDGLSTQLTNCILEDRYGFIWIGSQFGLNRYDGYSTTIFNAKTYDSTSIPDDWIYSLHEDNSGDLWLCTGRGLCRFNRNNETFTTYYPNEVQFNSKDNIVVGLFEDSSGMFWLVTHGGLFTFRKENKTFTDYKSGGIILKPENWGSHVAPNWIKQRFCEDNSGNIWIANHQNIQVFCKAENRFQTINIDSTISENHIGYFRSIRKDKLNDIWITTWGNGLWIHDLGSSGSNESCSFSIVPYKPISPNQSELLSKRLFLAEIDNNEDLWLGSYDTIYKYNYSTKTFTGYNFPVMSPYRFLFDKQNNIWAFGYGGGLNMFNPIDKVIYRFTTDPASSKSISENFVFDFMCDRAGSIYVLTHNEAVNRIDASKKAFRHIYSDPLKPGGLSGNSINTFLKDDDGTLYVGSFDGGLDVIGNNWDDESYDRITNYFYDRNDPTTVSSIGVADIYKDSKGQFWVGSYRGFNKFNPKSGKFIRYLPSEEKPNQIKGYNSAGILEDSRGLFWVLTREGGIHLMDRSTDEFFNLTESILSGKNIEYQHYYGIIEDHNKDLWIWSFTSGLLRLGVNNPKSSKSLAEYAQNIEAEVVFFQHNPDLEGSLSSNFVMQLFEDSSHRLWAATSKGLSLFIPETGKFLVVDERHGLPSQVICSLIEDDHGNLWMGTKQGISKITLNDFSVWNGNIKSADIIKSINNYTATDGLNGIDFFEKASYKAPTGELYFGGSIHGYNVFHPDSIKPNSYNPPVYITSFYKFTEKVQFDKIVHETDKIELSYWEDVFSFEFIALNYSNAGNNQYAYMLEGFDQDWVYCGNKREAKYTSIPPGEYTFRVKASNNDGEWNEKGDSIQLVINPPFWATWWFRTLSILIVLAAAISIYVVRVYSLEKQKKILEHKVKTRTREVVEQKNQIEEFNEELQMQKEEILAANEELQQQKEEIMTTNEALELQKEQILFNNEQLKQQKELIESAYHNVEMLSKIGQEITTHLSVEEIVGKVYESINLLLDASVFSIGIYNKKENCLDFRGGKEKGQNLPAFNYSLDDVNRPAVICYTGNKEVHIKSKDDYYKLTNQDVKVGELPESIIYLPLNVKDKKVGVITVQSFKEDAYSDYQINIIRNLAVYAAIAIDNAKVYRQLNTQKTDLQNTLDELKQAQTQLVQSEKLASVGQLTAGIAHEINNPINFISAGIDSLVTNIGEIKEVMEAYNEITPENTREKLASISALKAKNEYELAVDEVDKLIESIKDGTKRTTEIVNGLRTFSRLDEDVLKTADIHDGIDSTLILLHNKYKNRIKINKHYGEIPLVECFPGKLNQVFMNILSNAIDAIEKEGEINIKTEIQSEKKGDLVVIHISDTGRGMPDEIKNRIFEPFYTTKDVGKGTGLGLSIAKGIIEKHKGNIKVISEPGDGTEFLITLPLTIKNKTSKEKDQLEGAL